MQKITPFIWFEKGAREGADFYVSVFGEGSEIKNSSTVTDTPSGTVEVITFSLRGQEFTIMAAGPFQKLNESISFVIDCETQEEIDYFWEKLSAVPESEQCGWLKEKFGVSWQVVPRILIQLINDVDLSRQNSGSTNYPKIVALQRLNAFLSLEQILLALME